jgi:protein-S-isoprenylcysteine O-methyltransferase Ste14
LGRGPKSHKKAGLIVWLEPGLGKAKAMTIAEVQLVRKFVLSLAVLSGVLMYAVTASRDIDGMAIHELVEWVGIALIVVCILGRTWCTLYIGGRKIEQLVTDGPYSVSRNPLYFFSVLGAGGAGAQLGSVFAAAAFAALAWLVLYVVVLQEERLLGTRHGAAYRRYLASVPRFLPRPALWRDAPTITVMPLLLLRTFFDASFFLLAVPVAEMFEKLQHLRLLPVLFRLP